LYGFRRDQIEAVLVGAGVRKVHAAALWRWLYGATAQADESGTSLPAPLRRWLEARADADGLAINRLPIIATTASADDRARKWLLGLSDGHAIETVAMSYPGRVTACVSTQAGCAMGCVFCATGQMGFVRHLRAGEIVAQVLHVHRHLPAAADRLRNLVLMGMGEPLHNYDEVMQALGIVSDRAGLNIGPSRITVNTVGVVPGILRMADERQPYNLGVSLHGCTEAERAALVPVSARWPLDELLSACRTYAARTGRKIFFAWTLIDEVNDTPDHAGRLVVLLQGLAAHVNLIRLNATAGYAGADASDEAASRFRSVIQAAGLPCTIRQRRGIDVAAGCGQLRTEMAR
jgi:23S rRNA (adenine2503-C2)-methyltransferase